MSIFSSDCMAPIGHLRRLERHVVRDLLDELRVRLRREEPGRDELARVADEVLAEGLQHLVDLRIRHRRLADGLERIHGDDARPTRSPMRRAASSATGAPIEWPTSTTFWL